ncbi:hypothetical protein PFICI_13964 [Pestalotiopsis fici W106-1]|uniref:Uncharacterized protein n=1 Tax=Pestalotiopsis fici (strain W106-1 / CGMCC3.15140) TaxID=1229662 RepID=W3WJP8_PESFW|nr:uncharacterized protein PFICI_13964 [Pestalotiopsis fici W106-1]ETS74098.1 hypothetical protein PFICI_13964 [Pestalotiopsis fici W106-1]
MRLIHCREMRLVPFIGDNIPPYAILSHTWREGEVTYEDFGTPAAEFMAGWYKIQQTCKTAWSQGIEYAWVDTCCIDKSSSAELSEAINSMFQWYARSAICYAFLEDVFIGGELDPKLLDRSRWMSRGWTLQELIAPHTVVFFNRLWQPLKTREELSLGLSWTTGIPCEILQRNGANIDDLLRLVPVCQKMCWASKRQTTRIEDTAYCLMGLFGINMPLLYGEGSKAFIRLQEEIIRHNNDLTIFAWRAEVSTTFAGAAYTFEEQTHTSHQMTDAEAVRGLLAQSPREFGDAKFIEPKASAYNQEYTITNKGIRITLINILPEDNSSNFLMNLYCHDRRFNAIVRRVLTIFIRHIGGGIFVRVRPEILHDVFPFKYAESLATDLYLATSVTAATMASLQTVQYDAIRIPSTAGPSFQLQHVVPRLQIESNSGLFITRGFLNAVGYATYCYSGGRRDQERCDLVVFFGLDQYSTPWYCVTSPDVYPSFNHERWAQEENLKRHSLDAQFRGKSECELRIVDAPGISRFINVKGGFNRIDQIWDLSLEIVSTGRRSGSLVMPT